MYRNDHHIARYTFADHINTCTYLFTSIHLQPTHFTGVVKKILAWCGINAVAGRVSCLCELWANAGRYGFEDKLRRAGDWPASAALL